MEVEAKLKAEGRVMAVVEDEAVVGVKTEVIAGAEAGVKAEAMLEAEVNPWRVEVGLVIC